MKLWALWGLIGGSLSLFFLVCIISHTMIRNHRRIIQRAFKEYQGLGSTPRYSYLIGFGWSPSTGILRSSQVILMCQPRFRSTFGSELEAQFWWVNEWFAFRLPLPVPLRSVLYTGWKGASCVGLHSGAWLFLELLCESIWMVMFRRCSQWLTCWWAAPLKPRVGVALQLLHLATGPASLPGGWPGGE